MAKKTASTASAVKKPQTADRKPVTPKPGQSAKPLSGGKAGNGALNRQLIAERAYHIWQRTGNANEQANWVEAERQLRAERGV